MEKQPRPEKDGAPPSRPTRGPVNTWVLFLLLVGSIIFVLWLYRGGGRVSVISYNDFLKELGTPSEVAVKDDAGKEHKYPNVGALKEAFEQKQIKIKEKEFNAAVRRQTNVKSVEIHKHEIFGEFYEAPRDPDAPQDKLDQKLNEKFKVKVNEAFMKELVEGRRLFDQGVSIRNEPGDDSSGWLIVMYIAFSVLIFFVIIMFFRRMQSQMMGGGFLGGFSKSPARRYDASKTRVKFEDVAGLANVKSDLQELVEFLMNPEKFQRLGARIPKGTLLVGPPGTGKTLLARAVAGEAGVPFFSINGSEFIQMFVGVGASRVRDLFQTARDNSPCILFIDEIDAVGRVRGAGVGGGHDEREQTLNQILSEMDGFQPDEAVIVLAATNRPDVLDPALLRPGRFDRHITVDKPGKKARIELFQVHVRDVRVADDLDYDKLARGTVGLTGADIRNLVNEAALWATRQGKNQVEMDDFEHARDKILMGPKRDEVLTPREKKMVAYHECGHALVAWLVPGRERLHKITVIPRGRAMGLTQLMGEEDRMSISQKELHGMLMFMLGGRAAEKLVFDEYPAGAEDDLKKATGLARRMVTAWGMSERLGPVNHQTSEDHPFLGKEMHDHRKVFSEHTAQLIDEEVSRILHKAHDDAYKLLEANRAMLDKLAAALEEQEELDEFEVEELIGPSPKSGEGDWSDIPGMASMGGMGSDE